ILDGASLVTIIEPICAQLISLFDLRLAWVGEKRPEGAIRILSIKGDALAYGAELKKIGVRWDDTPLGQGPTGMAIRNNTISMLKIHDLDFSTWRDAAIENELLSVIAIPLSIHNEVYGAITLYSSNPSAFDDATVIKHLKEISEQIQVVLDAANSQEQLGLLSTALENAGNAVFITNQDGIIKWVNNAFSALTGYSAEESIGQSPHILSSGEQDIHYYIELWKSLLSGERWSSEIINRKKDGGLYVAQQTITSIYDEHGDIQSFIAIQEDVSDKREAEKRIKHLALHDPLTDLPNRTLFNDRIDQGIHNADRNRTKMGLMFIDLNLFKQVNDSFGHNAGDQLLIAVSERLLKLIRASDTLARIGGDEFTIIVNSVTEPEDLALIAHKIIALIEKPFDLLEHTVTIGCSIGSAIYPTNAADRESLLKQADSAMYRAKKSATEHYFFTED
ncbi:MAG: diguanylate cyclase, partial [Chromatiales bacterium]|nr:diguanylate cyclase [Chromatiales bacterium]